MIPSTRPRALPSRRHHRFRATHMLLACLVLVVGVVVLPRMIRWSGDRGTQRGHALRSVIAPCDGCSHSRVSFGARHTFTDSAQELPLFCKDLTGNSRILELYLSHWDVVSVVSHASTSTEVEFVQNAALCAAPLSLNEFGLSSATRCRNGEWFSYFTGCYAGRFDSKDAAGSAGSVPRSNKEPHWHRFLPGHRRTMVYASATVPEVTAENVRWQRNQHDSEQVRPSDVVVYVVSKGEPASTAGKVAAHAAVQATETMHAIALFGAVCER